MVLPVAGVFLACSIFHKGFGGGGGGAAAPVKPGPVCPDPGILGSGAGEVSLVGVGCRINS